MPSRNAIKVRHGIKWPAGYERKIYEVMARVLVGDAKAAKRRKAVRHAP
jgi:hypothetical protein